MSGMVRVTGEINILTYTKCHTFSESQAQADLNDDENFRNGQDVGNVRNSGMSVQIPSFIPFQNHNLELI